jgi:hypothetical protein
MPNYSEVTITFTNDWVNADKIAILFNDNGTTGDKEFTWVTTRTLAYEVTTGTPTANAGERAAINFKTAFDLDEVSGFVTTQTTNSVLIKSTVLGYDFTAVKFFLSANTGTGTVVFNNYDAPVTITNVPLALTRSPHYVNVPYYSTTTTKSTASVFIWDGDIATVPATATKVLTYIRPATNFAEINPDLSKIIRPELKTIPIIDITLPTQIIDSTADSVKWVYYSVVYTDAISSIADITGKFGAVDGYGYYSEGVNPSSPANLVLTSSTNRKISRDGIILLPFVNDGTITSIDIASDGAQISANQVITSSDQSTDYVQYVCVDVSQATTDDYITITTNPAGDVFIYDIIDECRYTPKLIFFKNRYGVFDTLQMFKKSKTSISVEKSDFVNNYISAGTYDTTVHQYKDINIQSKETISLNSGFINETENELYKELLRSDKIYFYENSLLVPVRVTTNSLDLKTRLNDGLINYSLDFEYAYNSIQNV